MYPVVGIVGTFPETDDDDDEEDGDGVAPKKKSLDPDGLPKLASKSVLWKSFDSFLMSNGLSGMMRSSPKSKNSRKRSSLLPSVSITSSEAMLFSQFTRSYSLTRVTKLFARKRILLLLSKTDGAQEEDSFKRIQSQL